MGLSLTPSPSLQSLVGSQGGEFPICPWLKRLPAGAWAELRVPAIRSASRELQRSVRLLEFCFKCKDGASLSSGSPLVFLASCQVSPWSSSGPACAQGELSSSRMEEAEWCRP